MIEITFLEPASSMNPAWIGIIGVAIGSIIGFVGQYLITKRNEVMQLRLAALDRRLEAHQGAFEMWNEMVHTLEKYSEHSRVIKKFDEWWVKNSVYLAPATRTELIECKNEYNFYEIYWHDWRAEAAGTKGEAYQTLKAGYLKVNQAGKKILHGINQPILDAEFKSESDFKKSLKQ